MITITIIIIITTRQHDKTQIPQYLVNRRIKPISQSLNDPNKQRLTDTHMHTEPLI